MRTAYLLLTMFYLRTWDRNPVGLRFSAPFQTALQPTPASYTVALCLFPCVKWPWLSVDYPPT